MTPKIKKVLLVTLGSATLGVGLGLAIAQQSQDCPPPPDNVSGPSDDGLSDSEPLTAGPAFSTDDNTDPLPPGTDAIASRKRRPRSSATKTKNPFNRETAYASLHAWAEADTLKRMNTYLGSQISTSPELGNMAVQQSFATAFSALDPKVPERTQHFAWVDKQQWLNPMGWAGKIQQMEATPAGWLVELRLTPIFATRARVIWSNELCVERWLFQGGNLQQVPRPHRHSPNPEDSLIID